MYSLQIHLLVSTCTHLQGEQVKGCPLCDAKNWELKQVAYKPRWIEKTEAGRRWSWKIEGKERNKIFETHRSLELKGITFQAILRATHSLPAWKALVRNCCLLRQMQPSSWTVPVSVRVLLSLTHNVPSYTLIQEWYKTNLPCLLWQHIY